MKITGISHIDGIEYDDYTMPQLYRVARRMSRRNRLFDAVTVLRRILGAEGKLKIRAMLLLARCYDRIGYLKGDADYDDLSLKTYRELLVLKMGRFRRKRILNEYGRVQERIRRFEDREYRAVEKAERLKRRKPKTPKAWFILGSNFNIRKDPAFVIDSYRNALAMDPAYIPALYRLGYIYETILRDIPRAREYYIRLVKLSPKDNVHDSEITGARCILDGCANLAGICHREGQHKKVMYLLTRAFYPDICAVLEPQEIRLMVKELVKTAERSARALNVEEDLERFLRGKLDTIDQ